MPDFRRHFHQFMRRLDGAREQKIVAVGAMALLAFLSVGPTVLNAAAHALTAHLPDSEAAAQIVMRTAADTPVSDEAAAPQHAGSASGTPAIAAEAAAPPLAPPLAFLFPQAGASLHGPIQIAARLENATAIAMVFEVTNTAGEAVASMPASPALSGEWSAILAAEPGDYVIGARASLADGRVVAFKERRAFRALPSETAPAPADAAEPLLELTAPGSGNSLFGNIAPLGVQVKNAQPNTLVFIVTSADGTETLVLGSDAPSSGYWTATFEGSDGEYRVRARAAIGDHDIFSPERSFILKAARN